MSGRAKNVVFVLVIVLLSGLATYLYDRYDQYTSAIAQESLGWPSVTGLVTRSNLETHRSKIGVQRNKTRYRVEVDYEYIVGDERYENDVVRFNQDELSPTDKERLVSAHPVGRRVEVFYNPSKPGQSVLVQGSYPLTGQGAE